MAIAKVITTPPEAPQRADPTNFALKADAMVTYLSTLVADINTWTGQANTLQTDINTSTGANATACTDKAAIAVAQADIATAQASDAYDEASRSYSEAERAKTFAEQAKSLAGTAITTTSTTSLTLSEGTKNLTVETGKAFVAGILIKCAMTADPVDSYMTGTVLSYNTATGALAFEADVFFGTGTAASWAIHIIQDGGGSSQTATTLHFYCNS